MLKFQLLNDYKVFLLFYLHLLYVYKSYLSRKLYEGRYYISIVSYLVDPLKHIVQASRVDSIIGPTRI